jgi:hypothetical protein
LTTAVVTPLGNPNPAAIPPVDGDANSSSVESDNIGTEADAEARGHLDPAAANLLDTRDDMKDKYILAEGLLEESFSSLEITSVPDNLSGMSTHQISNASSSI